MRMWYGAERSVRMRATSAALLILILFVWVSGRFATAQDTATLAGRWTLDRSLSQAPREIGFTADWMRTASGSDDAAPASGGGRGRRSSGGGSGASARPFSSHPESSDDAARVRQLTAEVRNPSAHLTIVDTPTLVTISDDAGQARTFHPDGRQDELKLGEVPLIVTAKREGENLVIVYNVEEGRQLRYTYAAADNPRRLTVGVKFVERNGGDEVRRTYEPASANEPAIPAPARPAAGSSAGLPASGSSAASASVDRTPFDQQPGAELKGLTSLGVVVETLSAPTIACGLTQDAMEAAVSKPLADAGLKVLRNSDEDTYVYVDIVTTSLPSGLCVSRYDATLYTHTTAKLSYQNAPVLVQVSLLHNGGLAGGSPAAHAAAVLEGVTQYIDQFAAQIRSANR
jgi:hypothetical protein